MAKKRTTQDSGFTYRSDASGNTTWSSGPDVYAQSRRIPILLNDLLSSNAEAPIELVLVLLDGVRPSSLNDIATQSSSLFLLNGVHFLQWSCSKSGVTQRREVSALTLKHWPRITAGMAGPCLSPFIPLADGHKQRMEEYLHSHPPYSDTKTPIITLEEDVLAWWSINLSPVMFAHLADLQTLNAVERSTLARSAFQRPLKVLDVSPDHAEDLGTSADFIDAATSSMSQDVHSGVIELALDIFGQISSPIDGLAKRHWLSDLSALINQSMHSGPWACLVLGWGCYMIEVGTLTEPNPAVSTLQSYFKKAARPLYNLLTNMPLDFDDALWSSDSLSDIFQAIIDQQSLGTQATMRAALRCFHGFMVEYFDIEPLRHILKIEESCRPTANLVWDHEVAFACGWARNHPDLYIGAPAKIVLSIANEAPCRAGELTRLRLCNIDFVDHDQEPYVEIEIARDASAGRLKTHTSPRRIFVRSPDTFRL
jgi:hypothetical protein